MENCVKIDSRIVSFDKGTQPINIYFLVYHIGSSCRVQCSSRCRGDLINWIADYKEYFPSRNYQIVEVTITAKSVLHFL